MPLWVPILVGVIALGAIYAINQTKHAPSAGGGGKYPFVVGKPGPGSPAPSIDLSSTKGGTWSLADQKGKTILLYFQEGVGCQPCWDQLKEIQSNWPKFQALGIDEVATITGDSLSALSQKGQIEGISSPLLSDNGLSVSKTYDANKYGMMGSSADGHSFIVVGPDGVIKWRGDYGGAPDFTMYLPVPNLIADMTAGGVAPSAAGPGTASASP